MHKITIDDVSDILFKNIVVASEKNEITSKQKTLIYCPFTKAFNIIIDEKFLWPEGERNIIYAVKRYNDIEI